MSAVQEELDTNENSCDHHGSNDCACHTDDHVFPGDTLLLAISRFATGFRLEWDNQNSNIIDWIDAMEVLVAEEMIVEGFKAK